MKKLLVTMGLTFALAACGGGGNDISNQDGSQGCVFNIQSILNGVSVNDQNLTAWKCTSAEGVYGFTIYADGTGLAKNENGDEGEFTWEETGCREITYSTAGGKGKFSDIQGSIGSGIMTFTDLADGSPSAPTSCTLETL